MKLSCRKGYTAIEPTEFVSQVALDYIAKFSAVSVNTRILTERQLKFRDPGKRSGLESREPAVVCRISTCVLDTGSCEGE